MRRFRGWSTINLFAAVMLISMFPFSGSLPAASIPSSNRFWMIDFTRVQTWGPDIGETKKKAAPGNPSYKATLGFINSGLMKHGENSLHSSEQFPDAECWVETNAPFGSVPGLISGWVRINFGYFDLANVLSSDSSISLICRNSGCIFTLEKDYRFDKISFNFRPEDTMPTRKAFEHILKICGATSTPKLFGD